MRRSIIALLSMVVFGSVGHSQDFKKVVDIVDEMESSLKTMIANEEGQRKTESCLIEIGSCRIAHCYGKFFVGAFIDCLRSRYFVNRGACSSVLKYLKKNSTIANILKNWRSPPASFPSFLVNSERQIDDVKAPRNSPA